MPLTEVVEVTVPLSPGLTQIALPVKTRAAGLGLVEIFIVLLVELHVVVAFVPTT